MKAIKQLMVLVLTCCETLLCFSQSNTVLHYLPEDAKMIIKINFASLGQRMKWEEFTKSKMFEAMIKDVSEEGKKFLTNPGGTGIDLSQGIFVFLPADKINVKSEPVIYGALKDTSQFGAMVRKLVANPQIIRIGKGKLVINKNTAIAWNKEIFIITGDGSKNVPAYSADESKTAGNPAKTKLFAEKCKVLLDKQRTPIGNEHFISLLKEDGDAYVWINNIIPSTARRDKTPQMVSVFSKNMMRSSNYTAGVITFQNGKISMGIKRYITATLDSLYKRYPVQTMNTELARRLPAGHPIVLYSFRFSPAMINEFIVKAGMDKYIDSLSKKKIKIDDIIAAVRGDVTAVIMKSDELNEADSISQAMNGIQVFVAGGINNKEKFEELSELLQAGKNDTAGTQQGKKTKPVILSKDSIFVLSLSRLAAQKFLESPGTNEEMKTFMAPYAHYPSACVVDLKTIFGFVMQGVSKNRSEEEVRQAYQALGMFDKLVTYGGLYTNGYLSSTMELILSNKEENSLKQFINLFELFNLMGNKKSAALQKIPVDVQRNR